MWAPMASSTGEDVEGGCVWIGCEVAMCLWTRAIGTSVLPSVRGCRSLISAMIVVAACEAASAASTEVPSVQ